MGVSYCEFEEYEPYAPIKQQAKNNQIVLRRQGIDLYPIHFALAFILVILFLTL